TGFGQLRIWSTEETNPEVRAAFQQAGQVDANQRALETLRTRAAWHVRDEDWQAAVTAYTRLLVLAPQEHPLWYHAAPLLLQSGDVEGYRRHRKEMLKRFGDTRDPVIAERTAKACLLLPADKEELKQIVGLAELAVREGTRHPALAYLELA